jgi:hypothetical protein
MISSYYFIMSLNDNKIFILLKKYSLLISLLSFSCVILFSLYSFQFSIFVTFLILYVVGLLLSSFYGYTGLCIFKLIYCNASIFSIVFFFIFKWQYGIPYGSGGSDSLAYEEYASIIANSILSYDSDAIGIAIDMPFHNSKGYVYFISILIRFSEFFGGFHTLIPRLVNSFLLGICSILIFGISKKILLNQIQSLNISLITGLFPIMIYVAIQSYRDIPILFIILSSVYLSLIFLTNSSVFKYIFISIAFIPLFLAMQELRLLSVINLYIIIIVTIILKIFSIKIIKNFYLTFFCLISYVLFVYIKNIELNIFLALIDKLDSSSNHLSEGVDRAKEGGLSLILFNLSFPLKEIASVFYSFITPLPIIYTSDIDWNFLSLGTIYQFIFIPFIFWGIFNSFRSSIMFPILIIFLLTYGGYVFGSFTFRHITYFVPFAAIYGVIGYQYLKRYRWIVWSIQLTLLFTLIITYYIIKY